MLLFSTTDFIFLAQAQRLARQSAKLGIDGLVELGDEEDPDRKFRDGQEDEDNAALKPKKKGKGRGKEEGGGKEKDEGKEKEGKERSKRKLIQDRWWKSREAANQNNTQKKTQVETKNEIKEEVQKTTKRAKQSKVTEPGVAKEAEGKDTKKKQTKDRETRSTCRCWQPRGLGWVIGNDLIN